MFKKTGIGHLNTQFTAPPDFFAKPVLLFIWGKITNPNAHRDHIHILAHTIGGLTSTLFVDTFSFLSAILRVHYVFIIDWLTRSLKLRKRVLRTVDLFEACPDDKPQPAVSSARPAYVRGRDDARANRARNGAKDFIERL